MLRARVEFAYGRTGRRAIQCDATRPPVKFSLRNRSAIGSALGVLLLAAAFAYRWLAPHGAAEPGNDVPGPAVPAMEPAMPSPDALFDLTWYTDYIIGQ